MRKLWIKKRNLNTWYKFNTDGPCVVVFTLWKLKTILPSMKVEVDKALKYCIVYKISCPQCALCYVGNIDCYLRVIIKEHIRPSLPVGEHLRLCHTSIQFESKESMSILHQTYCSIVHLMTQEAFCILKIKPSINTKDKYKCRKFTIRLWRICRRWFYVDMNSLF